MKKNPVNISHTVWYADGTRREKHEAADALGLTLYELTLRADEAAFQTCRSTHPDTRYWLVLRGHGNNGDDSYVVAWLAKAISIDVTLLAQESDKSLLEEAVLAREAWLGAGDEIHAPNIVWPESINLIVDALLSTGLQQTPHKSISQLIDHANTCPTSTVAADIPSGLLVETGAALGAVISADHTITSITLKPGLFTGKVQDITGQLHLDLLGLNSWLAGQETKIQRFSAEQLSRWLIPRRPTSYKDDHEQLVIINGDRDVTGVIRTTREVTLRAGADLTRVLIRSEDIVLLLIARPELMVHELTMDSPIESLEWTDVVVIGPGLGQQERGRKALQKVESFRKPILWDADVLNLLVINPDKRHNRVIMPCPGEATRLLGYSVAEVESNRLYCTQRLVQRYSGVVMLKGAGTVAAAHPDALGIIDTRNVDVANGSMGDVLSGIIGALLGQKISPYGAICAGCVARGATADVLAARLETCGMLATDLFSTLQHVVNPEVIDKNHDESSNSAP